jgi:histidinol-phosphate aminotransferase
VTLDPGDGMAFLSPTYSYYEVLAALFDARAIEHALGDGWQWPDSVWRGDERIFFIANPNPPVGTLYPLRDIARLCESRPRALVVVDEAYIAFAGEGSSAVPLLSDHSNLVVTRTFSKSHQLAGLRVGYALAHRDVLGALMKAKDSYNVNAVSQAAARAAIRDAAHFDETRRKIVAERRRLVTELSGRGFVIPPSEGNFLFAQHPRAPEIFAALRDRHIYVRWFDRPRTRLGLRITVGLPQQIDALLAGLDEILSVESPVAQSGR